jgi:hypothetical protein
MKTTPIGPFPKGIDNMSHDYALAEGCCLDACNVVVYPDGTYMSRTGRTPVVAVDRGHSLWSKEGRTFYGSADKLSEITALLPFSSTLLASGLSGNPISYAKLGDSVWWSNGSQCGVVGVSKTNMLWALPSPGVFVLSTTTGTMPSGAYRVALTYSDIDGKESAASEVRSVTLGTQGGIHIVLPAAASGAVTTNVYCTAENGSVLYLSTSVASASSSATLSSPVVGRELGARTFLAPQPAGYPIAEFNGRLLSATGKWLVYSDTYNFGLYNPLRDAIQFPDPITTLAPCINGVFVGTEKKTYWLQGRDIAQSELFERFPTGTIRGTEFSIPRSPDVGWVGIRGICIGAQDGSVRVPQEGTFLSPVGDRGAALVTQDMFVVSSVDGNDAYPPIVASEFIDRISVREKGL